MFKKSKGFTLMELLVVIAIIALLVVLIIAGLSAARSRARDSRRKQDIRSIQTGLAVYYGDNQQYPDKPNYLIGYTHNKTSEGPDYSGLEDFANEMDFSQSLPHDPKCLGVIWKGTEFEAKATGGNCWIYSKWYDYGYRIGWDDLSKERHLDAYVLGARLESIDQPTPGKIPGEPPTECSQGSVYNYCIGQYFLDIDKRPAYWYK